MEHELAHIVTQLKRFDHKSKYRHG